MKPSPRPPRTPSRLSDSVHHQLNLYALAAGAASGLLTMASPARAEIIYTPADVPIPGRYKLDLNHDAKIDFVLTNASSTPGSTAVFRLSVKGVENNGVENTSGKFASALLPGSQIGPQQKFAKAGLMAVHTVPFWTTWTHKSGPWLNVNNRYLGLKFTISGKTHYGWARLSVHLGTEFGNIDALLTGYAYETIANKAIIAGKTKGPDVVTMPPDTLGSLALGRK